MNLPPWHIVLPVMFGIGLTVYLASEFNDRLGWIYVIILLLGLTLAYKSFPGELAALFGNTGAPTPPPGGGPF